MNRTPPANPKIYHITHINNLPRIIQQGVLWSDAKRIATGLNCEVVGMSTIKQRRLDKLEVKCHPGSKVGEYVPFYLCPRSIMLYLLAMKNHPDLIYRGGQEPIVHLAADLRAAVKWAEQHQRRWALSDGNAGAEYTGFFASLNGLGRLNWSAIEAQNWRDPVVREAKQAEFLLHQSFPWDLVEKIGVLNAQRKAEVEALLSAAAHKPVVSVERAWYY